MKLLFDANLSPKLAVRLRDLFPGSAHVFDAGLIENTADEKIWSFARDRGFAMVTADSDFLGLLRQRGAPPYVIHLQRCDYKTHIVESELRRNAVRIEALKDAEEAYLVIRRIR